MLNRIPIIKFITTAIRVVQHFLLFAPHDNCMHSILLQWFVQRCTNITCQVTMLTKLCMVDCNTSGSLVWNLLHAILLAPTSLRILEFWEICAPRVGHNTLPNSLKLHPVTTGLDTGSKYSRIQYKSITVTNAELVPIFFFSGPSLQILEIFKTCHWNI